jgi:hypothetical protein
MASVMRPSLPIRESILSPASSTFPGPCPLSRQGTQFAINVVDHRPVQRALLEALDSWVKDGVTPPDSVYPRIAQGELTTLANLRFPRIDGVTPPPKPRAALRLDFGPEFETRGVILQEPPGVSGSFPVLVPQVDADGIDLGGIRLPEVSVLLATLTGWNLRAPERGASSEIAEFYGSTFPLPKTPEARTAAHDPRRFIAEIYTDRNDYLSRARSAVEELIRRRLVLPQDREFVLDRAAKLWDALAN